MDMLRRERETAALVAVRDAFPDLGAAVCIVALEVRCTVAQCLQRHTVLFC